MLELDPQTAAMYAQEQQERAFNKSLAYQIYEGLVTRIDLKNKAVDTEDLKNLAAFSVRAVEVFMKSVN